MSRRCLALAAGLMCCALAMHDGSAPPRDRQAPGRTTWPLVFEPNRGQADPGTQFVARSANYVVRAARGTTTFVRRDDAFGVSLVGANAAASAEGVDESSAKVNYLIGNTPSKWIVGVPTYYKVRYRGVYEGVDFILYGAGEHLEYDLVVHPRADPDRIALKFEGTERIDLDPDGDLVLTLAGTRKQVRQRRPQIHQVIDGARRAVEGGYVLEGDDEVAFWLGSYDRDVALTIDPVIVYSTEFGAKSDLEAVHAIAVDGQGNTYVAGDTFALDFPATGNALQRTLHPPAYGSLSMNAFVAKIDASGTHLVYATYLGGNGARIYHFESDRTETEAAYAIAVDAAGNAYVTGVTQSTDFPTVNAFQSQPQATGSGWDGFAAKLNPTGSALMYSTYLGATDGVSESAAIALDGLGNAYIAGDTSSVSRFPNTTRIGPPGATGRAFVTKFNQSGGLVYSMRLSGPSSIAAIAVDALGQAVIVGNTTAKDFPIVNAWLPTCPVFLSECDGGFVAKLSSSGSQFVYATYFGSETRESTSTTRMGGVALDAAGNAYVAGMTDSKRLRTLKPVQATHAGGFTDAFVASFGPTGGLRYSTYLGGSGFEYPPPTIAADPAGNAYIAGFTDSIDFPLARPLIAFHPGGPILRGLDHGREWQAASSGLIFSVDMLVIDPRTPATMYAATSSGVFKTTDSGTTWLPRSMGLPVGTNGLGPYLAIDPGTPSTLYVSTAYYGIFKTTDGAEHWSQVGSLPNLPGNIVIDSATSTVFVIGPGIRKSTDGGRTWTSSGMGLPVSTVSDLVIDPTSCGAILYAAIPSTNGENPVYESRDGGASWRPVSQGLPSGVRLRSLIMDPRDPATLYANANGYASSGAYRSTDRGRTWTQLLTDGRVVAVAPDAEHSTYAIVSQQGTTCLQRSTDRGSTWMAAGAALRSGGCFVATIAFDPVCPATLYTGGSLFKAPFLTRLAPDGSMASSTYLPGEGFGRVSVAADIAGNAYVAHTSIERPRNHVMKIAPLLVRSAPPPPQMSHASGQCGQPAVPAASTCQAR